MLMLSRKKMWHPPDSGYVYFTWNDRIWNWTLNTFCKALQSWIGLCHCIMYTWTFEVIPTISQALKFLDSLKEVINFHNELNFSQKMNKTQLYNQKNMKWNKFFTIIFVYLWVFIWPSYQIHYRCTDFSIPKSLCTIDYYHIIV